MRVAKWGNSLAVRLPASVKTLGLQEGDEVAIVIAGSHRFEIDRDDSRARALERLRKLRRPVPKGFRFDLDEANERYSFLDTNVLIYAFSDDAAKAERAAEALAAGGNISIQVLNEFVNVCRKKLHLDWKEIEERLAVVRALVSEVVPVSIDVHEKAVELAQDYGFSFYDALIVAAAVALDCRELLAEDMQDGRVVMNLTIRNPFASPSELGR